MAHSLKNTLPNEVVTGLLTEQPFGFHQLAGLRSVSKQFKALIDTTPKLVASKLHYIVLTTAPFSYCQLKDMRAVSRSFKEVIDTSPRLDATLFREKVIGKAKPGLRTFHPVLDGSVNLSRESARDVCALKLKDSGNAVDEFVVLDYPCADEQATSPPITSATIDVGLRPKIKNKNGITVKAIIEAFTEQMATTVPDGFGHEHEEYFEECFPPGHAPTFCEALIDHCFFEGFGDWGRKLHTNTGHLVLTPRYGS